MTKPRGYYHQIVELFPIDSGTGFRELHSYDNLEDAEKVMEVLESVNWNFTCYAIVLRPVWEDEYEKREAKKRYLAACVGWDANGSPTTETPKQCDHSGSTAWMATNGETGWSCPKCGASSRTDPWK
jgi:hypothetical protein